MGTVNKIFWIFFAVAMGIILFASIQNKLPNELGFLKQKEGATPGASSPALAGYEGWTILSENGAVELRKSLVSSSGGGSDPIIGVLCDKGTLNIRVDPKFAAEGKTTAELALIGTQSLDSLWYKTKSTNLIAPRPREVLGLLLASSTVQLQMVASGGRRTSLTLDTKGLAPLVNQFPLSCQ